MAKESSKANVPVQEEKASKLNLSFQAEVQLIGDNIGMQVQNIDNTTVYFIAPIEKEPSKGISLDTALKSIGEAVKWFGTSFDLKTADITNSIEKIMNSNTEKISLYLKTAYLFRKQVNGENETMEFAIGVGVNFGNSEAGTKLFAINNLSFCVWKFETTNQEAGGEASKKRREAVEKRMGIVDLASDDQILQYISADTVKALENAGNNEQKKIEEKGDEEEDGTKKEGESGQEENSK